MEVRVKGKIVSAENTSLGCNPMISERRNLGAGPAPGVKIGVRQHVLSEWDPINDTQLMVQTGNGFLIPLPSVCAQWIGKRCEVTFRLLEE